MAVATLIVAALTLLVATAGVLYQRGQQRTDRDRRRDELAPRFEGEVSGTDEGYVLSVRLLPDQRPRLGLKAVIRSLGASFDSTRCVDGPGLAKEDTATWEAPLFPGARASWPLYVDRALDPDEVSVEITDQGDPERVGSVTVPIPPEFTAAGW
jgi:hypothetical protein